jgi:hypothetical protein
LGLQRKHGRSRRVGSQMPVRRFDRVLDEDLSFHLRIRLRIASGRDGVRANKHHEEQKRT